MLVSPPREELSLLMKTLLIVLLCASLAANAILYVRSSPSHSTDVSVAAVPAKTAPAGPANSPEAPARIPDDVRELLATNNPDAIRRLRGLGYSEKALAVIARAMVDAQFRDRRQALDAKENTKEFWKSTFHSYDRTLAAARLELQREEQNAMKKLLGDNYVPETSRFDERYGNLPPAKLARLKEITEDYQSLIMAAQGSNLMTNVRFPEDQEKLAYLQKEQRAEIKQLLTPEELFEYDLRVSPTAMNLKWQLAGFEPTEEEFRAMFKVAQAIDERSSLNPYDSSRTAMEARQKLQAETDAAMKALLPPERFADYQRSSDFDYKRFYEITKRLELPRESATAAYALKTAIEEKRSQIQRDPAMRDPTARNEALTGLVQDAEAGLKRILGESGYQAYVMSQGNFVLRIKPRVTAPRKG